jgi:predicted nucleic acid-binding protein
MPLLLWDASALAKRYVRESGTETTNALFAAVPSVQQSITLLGYIETVATVVRARNRGQITRAAFQQSYVRLRDEVANDPGFGLIDAGPAIVLGSVALVLRDNLNSTDAIILTAFLDFVSSLPQSKPTPIVVASDTRLLRAASSSGFMTVNPQLLSPEEATTFLESLS